jgi:hypothetical protein
VISKKCEAPGCSKTVRAGSICDMHKARLKRHGVFEPNIRRTGAPQENRFWANVRMWSLTAPGCLEWMGALSDEGYGRFRRNRMGMDLAHRVAWELSNGASVPDGMIVRHACDNPRCVNPEHLLIGTHQDNSDDKWRRGRAAVAKGEANGRAKLDAEMVGKIRRSSEPNKRLAEKYGVTDTLIRSVKSRKLWAHVE